MLKEKAREVLQIIETGGYNNPAGQWVDCKPAMNFAIQNGKTYLPDQLNQLLLTETRGAGRVEVSVTSESTQIAIARLIKQGCDDPLLLNFASAKNHGGGFINGAKAQEEDLCRCSALYACLLPQHTYYKANRAQQSMLYTDHMIYSPKVPWFRTRSRDEPDELILASVITAPAPNAGQALSRGVSAEQVDETLLRRCGQVLTIARDNGHRDLVLGAWGCGVFRNDPTDVAEAFKHWLDSPVFTGAFGQVVFAVYGKGKAKANYDAFAAVFDG